MASQSDRRYLESHEWHKLDGGTVLIGISQFAVEELTDITFLDLTRKSGAVKAGDTFGEIESVKATSELYCGIDGEVIAVNDELLASPEKINDNPWDAWLIKIKPSNPAQLEQLLDAAAYDAQHSH